MDRKSNIADSILPTLLGGGLRANLFAMKIYLKLGIVSYICSERCSMLTLLNPAARHFSTVSDKNPDIVCSALDYLTRDGEFLAVLVPCTDLALNTVREKIEFLEERFIVADQGSFFDLKPMILLK